MLINWTGIEPSIDDSEFEEGEEGEELFEEDGEEEEVSHFAQLDGPATCMVAESMHLTAQVGEDEADSEIEGDAKRQRR